MVIPTGTRTTPSMISVMTATAKPRRAQSRLWIIRISGQVATTIMTAQIAEGRNGVSTQKLAASRPPNETTASKTRVTSQVTGVGFMAPPSCFATARPVWSSVLTARSQGPKHDGHEQQRGDVTDEVPPFHGIGE